ncbi:unnamed protein product [Linum tenue]|uniref:Uncharacterized protein n=1 Tax=Linum tenue TaxID=586396 RepID=A0AAV0LP07_9ROSI|nr:unnamed protein product [Linum tenue]
MAVTTTTRSSLIIGSLLLSFLAIQLAHADLQPSPAPYAPKFDCGGACTARCQLSSRPNLCKRACGTCCVRCSCVPPGTAGNYEKCACYGGLTTHGGVRKCP